MPARIVPTFGDRDFHLALAELTLGWLLSLCREQLSAVAQFPAAFAQPNPEVSNRFREAADALLAAPQRCRTHVIDREGMSRRIIETGAGPRAPRQKGSFSEPARPLPGPL